jgi:FkbM family methyltransferase
MLKYRRRTLPDLSHLVPDIFYVMCGARGETSNRLMPALPQIRFLGFEPDTEEYARLTQNPDPAFRYFNVAVGDQDGSRKLYVTRNPACSSLFPPNYGFQKQFKDGATTFEIVAETSVNLVSLDSYLPAHGVKRIDILDLDTQGNELEILRGARDLVRAGVVVVRTEVEFSELYQRQPLFGNVDAFLRDLGFMLFDLSCSRYRREKFPAKMLTRGQLLWGNATYLRNHEAIGDKQGLFRLALLAAHLQFHDYALEVMDSVLGGAASLSAQEATGLKKAREQYLRDLRSSAWWVNMIYGLESVGLKRPVKLAGRLTKQLSDRLRKDRLMTESSWED